MVGTEWAVGDLALVCSHEAVNPHQLLLGKGWGVLDCRNGWQWLRGHFAGFGMSGKSEKQQLNANNAGPL